MKSQWYRLRPALPGARKIVVENDDAARVIDRRHDRLEKIGTDHAVEHASFCGTDGIAKRRDDEAPIGQFASADRDGGQGRVACGRRPCADTADRPARLISSPSSVATARSSKPYGAPLSRTKWYGPLSLSVTST